MPIINTENDDHTFIVQVKDKCSICVDAFELSGKLMESSLISDGKEPTIDEISDIMKEICWTQGHESMDEVTKYELFAVASKAIDRMNELGK